LISSGVIDAASLITGELPLEGVEEALHRMMAGTCIKMAIVPDGTGLH
jgi:Zn-dependent alcohol dehydrogenase